MKQPKFYANNVIGKIGDNKYYTVYILYQIEISLSEYKTNKAFVRLFVRENVSLNLTEIAYFFG